MQHLSAHVIISVQSILCTVLQYCRQKKHDAKLLDSLFSTVCMDFAMRQIPTELFAVIVGIHTPLTLVPELDQLR